MPAPSDLAIATSAVQRLVKEEASYRDELLRQEAHVTKLEKDVNEGGADLDENAEYMLKQEVRGGQRIPSHSQSPMVRYG